MVGVRLSVDDYRRPADGGLGPEGLREVARALVDTGHIDYLNQSSGSRSSHYALAVASYHHPPGELLPLIAQTRRAIGARVPVVGVGRVTTPELAERALADETCDLVAMTRAQIADPDVVAKLRRGEPGRIRPCVGANQGCVDRMAGGLAITCLHNPEVGREYRLGLVPAPADEARRVLVVGAGPAGLAAARTAALRGHRVELVDRRRAVGGRLGLLADCGPASTLLESVRWLRDELERLRVRIDLGVEVDAAAAARERRPAVVVLATGARPAPERLPAGDGSVRARHGRDRADRRAGDGQGAGRRPHRRGGGTDLRRARRACPRARSAGAARRRRRRATRCAAGVSRGRRRGARGVARAATDPPNFQTYGGILPNVWWKCETEGSASIAVAH